MLAVAQAASALCALMAHPCAVCSDAANSFTAS